MEDLKPYFYRNCDTEQNGEGRVGLKEAINGALEVAKKMERIVEFIYAGVSVYVGPDSKAKEIHSIWELDRAKHRVIEKEKELEEKHAKDIQEMKNKFDEMIMKINEEYFKFRNSLK